jgi:hypothetical protein
MTDEAHYHRSVRRMRRTILVLAAVGGIVAAIIAGPRTGLGFLLGAAVSFLSFWRYQRIAESLGRSNNAGRPRVKRFMIQFALLAGAGYVIVKYLEVNRMALAIGLLVAGVAVTIEILYELIYGI